MEPAEKTRFTEDEYLALERASRTKHEFVDGQIVAMAGGSPRHNLIAANVCGALRGSRRGSRCIVFNSDQRVHVASAGRYTYPDVTVVCGQPVYGARDLLAVENPAFVVEVLSRSTAHYDLGTKLDDLRTIPTLREFMAVRTDARHVEYWQRTDVGRWLVSVTEGDGVVALTGLGITLPLAEIYDKVDLLGDGLVP